MKSKLSQYFQGVGIKRLSEVEVSKDVSNQHEFNGIKGFKNLFGEERKKFNARFIHIGESEEEIIEDQGELTWYDSRERHPTRSEHRLYYTSNNAMDVAKASDIIVIGLSSNAENTIEVFIAKSESDAENQLLWLFGFDEIADKFIVKDYSNDNIDINYAGRKILDSLGFDSSTDTDDNLIDLLLRKFGRKFPKSYDFSVFAREFTGELNLNENPDEILIAWMNNEELLFKTLERLEIEEKIKAGFGENGYDADEFVKYSLGVQNRRKSRAGHAFENHLKTLFDAHKISYTKGGKTEMNKKPDFIFPSIEKYHEATTNLHLLTMLGVKTTAKDRWRQILSEASKIESKHLVTLEPAISRNQTDEMKNSLVQLCKFW